MALIKNNFGISFQGGLSTKTDPKQNIPGSFRILENAIFTQIDSLSKRFGYNSLSNKNIELEELTNQEALAVFKNELNMYADNKFYSYSSSIDRWNSRGNIYNVPATTSAVIRNSYQQEGATVAISENISLYAWEDSRGGVRATTSDAVDGTQFLSDFEVSSTGTNPKVVVLFNTFTVIPGTTQAPSFQIAAPAGRSAVSRTAWSPNRNDSPIRNRPLQAWNAEGVYRDSDLSSSA